MSSNLKSRYNQEAQYKGFSGEAGDNTRVANVWVEHFECGFWMGDYVDASQMLYTNGMVIENARIRNNLADGVNFAQAPRTPRFVTPPCVAMVTMVWLPGRASTRIRTVRHVWPRVTPSLATRLNWAGELGHWHLRWQVPRHQGQPHCQQLLRRGHSPEHCVRWS